MLYTSCLVVFLLILLHATGAIFKANNFRPIIWSKFHSRGTPILFGLIRENETTVHMYPQLSAFDRDTSGAGQFICSYAVLRNRKQGPIPFEIILHDKLIGAAEVRARPNSQLSVVTQQFYKIGVVARDCGRPAKVSKKAYVLIKVVHAEDDVNLAKETYSAYVEEGRMYDSILTIKETDVESFEGATAVCGYEIVTDDVPFEISPEGALRNLEPLDYSFRKEYFFGVVANDCSSDGKSKPLFIKILVAPSFEISSSPPTANIQSSVEAIHQRVEEFPSSDTHDSKHAPTDFSAVFIIVICVVLFVVIVVFVIFIWTERRRRREEFQYSVEEEDLEWDNSTLNLIKQ